MYIWDLLRKREPVVIIIDECAKFVIKGDVVEYYTRTIHQPAWTLTSSRKRSRETLTYDMITSPTAFTLTVNHNGEQLHNQVIEVSERQNLVIEL